MTTETATVTDVMPAENPPATVTVRRSWAIGGALVVAVVIVAMAIALAAVAGDDGPGDGFQQGPESGMPAITQSGVAPPQGIPDHGAIPLPPDMPGQSSQTLPSPQGSSSSQGSSGSQVNPGQ